jgi:hypothetical protein
MKGVLAEVAGIDQEHSCAVCNEKLDGVRKGMYPNVYLNCPQCGLYGLTVGAESALRTLLDTARKRAVLSHAIRKTPNKGDNTKLFDEEQCKKILDADELPTPEEQGDNLIRWLGENLPRPGRHSASAATKDN